jgi:Zn-dependent protease with chaperone function
MPEDRRSLTLTVSQWKRLEELAASTNSVSTKGPEKGKSSWRALIRRIASGELKVIEVDRTSA